MYQSMVGVNCIIMGILYYTFFLRLVLCAVGGVCPLHIIFGLVCLFFCMHHHLLVFLLVPQLSLDHYKAIVFLNG